MVYIRKKPSLEGLLLGPTATDILTVPLVDICVEHFTEKNLIVTTIIRLAAECYCHYAQNIGTFLVMFLNNL